MPWMACLGYDLDIIALCQFILIVAELAQRVTSNDINDTTDVDVAALNTWQSNVVWNCNTPPVKKDFSVAPYIRHIDGGHRILLHGGTVGQGQYSDETWVYSVEANVWSNVTDDNIKPQARRSHTMVTLCNNTVILFGGKDNENKSLNETWIFETDTLTWRRPLLSTASHPIFPMFTHATVAINSRNQTDCQCKQSVLVIPGPADGLKKAKDWSTVWELVCVEDKKEYQWYKIISKPEEFTPKGDPWLATGTRDSEIPVIALNKNGLWTYNLTEKTWEKVQVRDRIKQVKSTAIALYFPLLQSYVIIMETSYMRYNITSGNLIQEETSIGQTSVFTRGGKAAMFGSYAIVYRGAAEACRQSLQNLTRQGNKWLTYRLPDSLLTPIFGYQLVLGIWKDNFYVIGSPNESDKLYNDKKTTFWKLNLATKQWFQLDNKDFPARGGRITNSVLLQDCTCFVAYRRRFSNEIYVYYPDQGKWKVNESKVAPSPRRSNSFVAFNSSVVLLFGGFKRSNVQKSETLDDLWMLSFVADKPEWRLLDSSNSSTTDPYLRVRPKARALHASVVIDHRLLIYGGIGDTGSAFTDMWSFNMTNYYWTRIEMTSTSPVTMNVNWKMSAVTVGHQMLVTVGCSNVWNRDKEYCDGEEKQATWMYCPHRNKWTLLSTTKLLSNLFNARKEISYQSNTQFYKGRLLMVDNREISLIYSYLLACPLGHVSPDIVSTQCKTCPSGQFSDDWRKTCSACPHGLTTESRRSSHLSNCSRCVDDYCSYGDCIVTVSFNKPAPGCHCHFGFTGSLCQAPTYIILGIALILLVILICLSAAYGIGKWRHKQLREGQLQRSVEELTSVWQIGHDELQVLDRIGEGGYGKVHKAVYREVEVAVKLLRDVEPDHHLINEFEREILFMQTVRHPNIVMFIGAGPMDDGSRFLVTEFMHRGSLRDVLETKKADGIGFITQIEFAIDAAKGMEFLHSLTPVRIHRDLKSPNLLVSRAWMVKVGDFGLGRQILTKKAPREERSSTITSPLLGMNGSMCTTRVGTVQWRAPELSTSERYGTSADIYSFGIVLWEMQTCEVPFSHYQCNFQIEDAVLAGERPRIPNTCNGDFRKLITDCWHANPTQRPSFSEILIRLNRLYNTCLAT